MHIRDIRKERSSGSAYTVYYMNNWGESTQAEVFAKDELEAFTEFQKLYKKGEDRVRTFFVCLTVVILALLSSLTYSCTASDATVTAQMRECLKAGKSYVRESSGYSCRDPFMKATN